MNRSVAMIFLVAIGCGGGSGNGGDEHSPTPIPLACVWASLDMRIFRSDDAGRSWQVVADETADGLHFIDRERGWTAQPTFPSQILHTDDGGDSWVGQRDNVASDVQVGVLRDVAFLTAQKGAAVGNGPDLTPGGFDSGPALALVTDDGGDSWRRATIDTRNDDLLSDTALVNVCFTETGIGLTCGGGLNSGTCLLSTDIGETWADISSDVCGSLGVGCPTARATACVGAGDLWIAGPSLIHSADGGATWQVKTDNLPPERPVVRRMSYGRVTEG